LRSLELVDADTLTALLLEARRQRRSLRQVLLSARGGGGTPLLTLRPGDGHGTALLRHLAEAEMPDAVHPDEFRQRFAALAAVRHPHLAATLEVLEVNGRPAALQEWLSGLPPRSRACGTGC
jgi:hypothetical protein